MKIAFIDYRLPELIKNKNYPIGGWPVELMNWLQGLSNHDSETFLLTNEESALTLDFDACTLIGTHNSNYKGVKYLKYFYYILPKQFFSIKKLKPDFLIQGCAGLDTGLLAVICKVLKIPFIYRVVSDLDVTGGSQAFKIYESLAFKLGLWLADGFVCQNHFQYTALKEKFPNKAITTLYNPFICTMNNLPNSKENRSYFAWVGNFRWQKNLSLLYELANGSPNIKFKIAGQANTRMDESTKAAYKDLLTLPNVEFMGHINNSKIPEFLESAIALLNTSDVEGFSNTYLEAFSVGTPVLTRTLADPDNIIKKNKLGYSAEDKDLLLAEISNYQDMSIKDYQTISENCFKYVRINHDPVKLTRELICFLKKTQE
jgi:glycosyltransferase involved in cell wall biosynthesis